MKRIAILTLVLVGTFVSLVDVADAGCRRRGGRGARGGRGCGGGSCCATQNHGMQQSPVQKDYVPNV